MVSPKRDESKREKEGRGSVCAWKNGNHHETGVEKDLVREKKKKGFWANLSVRSLVGPLVPVHESGWVGAGTSRLRKDADQFQ